MLFCLKGKDGYRVTFEHFAETLKCKRVEREKHLQTIIERYAERLEYYSIRYPYQWYNFYNFWLPDDAKQIKH